MSRRAARKEAFSLIFQSTFLGGETIEDQLSHYFENQPEPDMMDERDYFEKVVRGVTAHWTELTANIAAHALGWKPERISRVARCTMCLALYEIEACDDISTSVAINEAVELTKIYDSPEAAAYVNGVLGGIVNEEPKHGADTEL